MDEREELLAAACEENSLSMEELNEQYGPESFGNHEAVDRIYVTEATWSEHIASHPAILLDAEAYQMAVKVSEMMAELYNRMSAKD
ncbi:hypothetical protein Pan97_34750 [Bremerella volcania]|uniref:Uncharacterized protein n=1 Tax=Bremerella volcania TaxID=2527984 RepID=A0A518CB16_9BACT|nr:hypothetical protein [Bremerella volcania]QDU76426.1 hypothetical protein Pan97_34750 [Bremerella volcania]